MLDRNDIRHEQLNQFSIIERVCSVFSLLGCVFIIATFCYSKTFHKPINRLVFYASFGNMMTNVGTLMARSYVGDSTGPGCQFQAFLIQMFMPADTFWTLAMAVNVYLTFYHKFDAQKLRRMEVPYLLFCYGIPFIVALVYLFIDHPKRGKMYADATLWCWISPNWDIWRIATFYGPIWVVIILTFFIYIRAGGEIYRKHRQLKNFGTSSNPNEPEPLPPMDDPFSSMKTTEVCVTSEAAAIDLTPLGRRGSEAAAAAAAAQQHPKPPNPAYSVTISSSKRAEDNLNPSVKRESYGDITTAPAAAAASGDMPIRPSMPSSSITPPRPQTTTGATAVTAATARRWNREANSAAWSYTKCALLFFTAMLVTWIPSSANRVYSVVHVDQVNLTLEYMSAFVLPLQGFWNAIIYVMTSWKACQLLFHDMFLSRRPVTELVGPRGVMSGNQNGHSKGHHSFHQHGQRHPRDGRTNNFQMVSSPGRSARSSDKSYESESMTELAASTHTSHEEEPRNDAKIGVGI